MIILYDLVSFFMDTNQDKQQKEDKMMYNKKRIKEVIEECLKDYTMGDTKTDKEEKESFVESVMVELRKEKRDGKM